MRFGPKPLVLSWLILIAAHGLSVDGYPQKFDESHSPQKFDEYGAIPCDDEWARLDNYAIQVQNAEIADAVVIVYGGRRGTMRDEVQARISFIKHYLTVSRSIKRRRIVILNGGFRESFTTELWLIPRDLDPKSLVHATVIGKDVRFKRGRVGNRTRNCSFIG